MYYVSNTQITGGPTVYAKFQQQYMERWRNPDMLEIAMSLRIKNPLVFRTFTPISPQIADIDATFFSNSLM